MKLRLSALAAAAFALFFAFAPFTSTPADALSPAGVTSKTLAQQPASNAATEVRWRGRRGLRIYVLPRRHLHRRHCYWTERRVCVKWRHGKCKRRAWRNVRVCPRRW